MTEEPAASDVVPPTLPTVALPATMIEHPTASTLLVPVFNAVRVHSMLGPDWVQDDAVIATSAVAQKPKHWGLVVALITRKKATWLMTIPNTNIATATLSEFPGLFSNVPADGELLNIKLELT